MIILVIALAFICIILFLAAYGQSVDNSTLTRHQNELMSKISYMEREIKTLKERLKKSNLENENFKKWYDSCPLRESCH